MNDELQARIQRAQELVRTIHHVPLATVNDDGSPHMSPVFLAFDDALTGYWSSHPETAHSHNLTRDPQVFLVVFDSKEGHGGLYVRAEASVITDKTELAHGLALLAALKESMYGSMGPIEQYLQPGGPRIYKAVARQLWVNKGERDAQGVIVRDNRFEIHVQDILN